MSFRWDGNSITDFKTADQEHEWLCPNHHAILHLWIDDDQISPMQRGRRAAPTVEDVDLTEIDRLMELTRRAGRRRPNLAPDLAPNYNRQPPPSINMDGGEIR
jgi:hypothetical protein